MNKPHSPPVATAPREHDQVALGEPFQRQFLGANGVGWLMSAIMLLLLFAGGALLMNPIRLLITGERAQGVVVDMARDGGLIAPIVEFVASTGEPVRVTSRVYSSFSALRAGDSVNVAYRPTSPADAHLLLLREFSAAGYLLGITGGSYCFGYR